MAEAMSKILGSTLRKADASTPILARSRGAERKLEEEKMEAKAKKAITNEKKRLANKDRVKPDYTGMEYEKKLRKVATRGGKADKNRTGFFCCRNEFAGRRAMSLTILTLDSFFVFSCSIVQRYQGSAEGYGRLDREGPTHHCKLEGQR